MISCLTITRPQRADLLRLAIGDFAAQVHAERELLVVHDADPAFERALEAMVRAHPQAAIRTLAVAPGRPLGELRNLALDHARGDFVCQWDDDDRCHPLRLQLQWEALVREDAACCFLVDQLHWFPARGELWWDDWDAEPYPMNLVQGTLLGRRQDLPRYPALPRGEDTPFTLDILRAGHRVARLAGCGWAYVYVYHGRNAWDEAHQVAISRLKHLSPARLAARETLLRARLAEYAPPLPPARMPCGSAALALG